ncbi:hypothetical protein [Proteus sp. STS61-E]|uniref:hypothetical protein n=1 Tax=Proteus sp. STS61-E TaxID=3237301 RepID=UPI0034C5E150
MNYKEHDINLDKLLRINSANVENTIHFLNEGVNDISINYFEIPIGYRLVKSLRKDQYRLITTDKESETAYLVELRFRQDIVYGKTTCTQIKVWRSRIPKHRDAIRELPRTFFCNLLKVHNIVVTDEEQTSDGKGFWIDMILWAFSKGHYIYASDGTEEDRPLHLIDSIEDFYNNWDTFCWGKDRDTHTHRLLIISKEKLSQ